MKLSSREKTLLAVTLILVVAVAYYFLVFVKLQEKISFLEDDVTESQMRYDANEQTFVRAATIDKEIDKLKKEIYPVAKHYYGTTDQEEFIAEIEKINRKSGMNVTKITFSPDTIVNLREPLENENGVSQVTEKKTEGTKEDDKKNNLQLLEAKEGQNVDPNGENFNGYSQNIQLMQTEIDFIATYAQIDKWLKAVDKNKKNIISGKLQVKRKELQVKNNDKHAPLKGTVRLSFYQVIDADKYTKPITSFLKKKPIRKTKYKNPFRSYPWAWIREVVSSNNEVPAQPPISYNPLDNGFFGFPGPSSDGFFNGGNSGLPFNPKQPKKGKLRHGMLYDFEDGVLPLKKDYQENVASAEIETKQVSKGKSALKVNYSFMRSDLQDKIIVDLTEKNLVLNNPMNMIRLNVYAEKENFNEVGLLLSDKNGQKYQIVLAKEVSWQGWKELKYDFHGISTYPIRVSGIYISYGEKRFTNTSSLIFDNMNISYYK